jgi:hypothetical protein
MSFNFFSRKGWALPICYMMNQYKVTNPNLTSNEILTPISILLKVSKILFAMFDNFLILENVIKLLLMVLIFLCKTSMVMNNKFDK